MNVHHKIDKKLSGLNYNPYNYCTLLSWQKHTLSWFIYY